MLGLRTPVKTPRQSLDAAKAPLHTSKELVEPGQTPEVGAVVSDPSLPPSKDDPTNSSQPSTQDKTPQGEGPAPRRIGAPLDQTFQKLGSPEPETTKLKGRAAEAKACLMKAKLQLNNSRNLKAEIKTEVIWAIEKLYRLVKESEAAGLRLTQTTGNDHNKPKELPKVTQQSASAKIAANTKGDAAELTRALEEHKKLVQENTAQMKLLKVHLDKNASVARAAPLPHANDALVVEVRSELQQQKEVASATRDDLGALKDQVSHLSKNIQERIAVTYANVAAGAPRKRGLELPQSFHSMVVSSVDAHDKSEDIIDKIRTAVNAKTSGVRVDRLRKAKDQKVVLGCQSREELARVVEKLKTGSPTLLTQEVENRDPLVVLLNVLSINTDEDILGALKRQNGNVLGTIPDDEYRASVRYRRRARNPLENHVVLQVSPQVWQQVTAVGKVHIDLQRVVAKDQSPLVTCSRCLGYGHGRRTCEASVDTCSHCTGPHLRSECPAWKAGDRPTCCNCQSSRLDRTDHNSFDNSCPIRKKWDALARAKVAYC
ncbi:uncharacterized protein [Maniola hyperantus]|uniref:uncharacterized protein n=1 Tax=Aphantopus hyperantus TaxID=2795564 RepID=UPI00374A17DD